MVANIFSRRDLIFLPSAESYLGGPATFLHNLSAEFRRKGVPFTSNPEAHGIRTALVPISLPIALIERWKAREVRIVQRLDGVYYPSKHGESFSSKNAPIQQIFVDHAESIIYQSRYSYLQCRAMLGIPGATSEHIILNGSDPSLFFPAPKPPVAGPPWVFATSGNFRNVDMIEPLVRALDMVSGDLRFELRIFGDITNDSLQPFFDRPYIKHSQKAPLRELAEQLRRAHAFVYSHLNPPCPNSVIEAISTGLPVVGFDSGSMAELLWFQRDLLAPVSGELIQLYSDFQSDLLAGCILKLSMNYERYSSEARRRAGDYSMTQAAESYARVLRCLN